MSDHGRAHALLSPSSAERWIACPASVRLIETLDRSDDGRTEWSEEGTRAHNLAEIEAAYAFGLTTKEQHDTFKATWLRIAAQHDDDVEEMERHVRTYVSMLQDIAADMGGNVTIRLEIRVQTGIAGCWGTADAALMSDTKIHIVDFKYGQGVIVRATHNPQIMLYAVGVLELLDLLGTIETVGMSICQPRVTDGLTSWTTKADSLRRWRDRDVLDAARESQSPDARFGPSEAACRWCPAAGICKARMRHVTQRDFGNPDLMDEEELAEAFRRIAELRDWAKAVEAEALSKAYSEGKHLPGLKVVMSGGKRSITDDERAIETLVAAGYSLEAVSRLQPETLGNLEKVVGKTRLPEVLGDLLKKGKGSPSLVDESDERPAVNKMSEATNDFQDK